MSNSLLIGTSKTYAASLVLNFDGANNSTTFTDSSSYNHTGTAYGNAQISTVQSKFGGSSGYFDSAGDYVQFSDHSSFDFGTGDFTIECWVYPNNISGTQVIWSRWNNNGDNKLQLYMTNGKLFFTVGSVTINSGNFLLSSLVWSHISVCRLGSNIFIYLNGSRVSSGSSSDNVDSTSNFVIGANNISSGGANYFNGYIDSLRITKGAALYTGSAYPIPTIPVSKNSVIAPQLNNHIVMVSSKSSGDIIGSVSTSSGYYTINWWDGTKTTYSSGDNFAKATTSGDKYITIYPSTSGGSLSGYFYSVDISNNELTSVRAFYSKFITAAGIQYPGSNYTYYYWLSYPNFGYNRTIYVPGPYVPGDIYNFNISSNSLTNTALNQLYMDLLIGTGTIEVSDNTGCDSDDPSIATNKGYTIFGSVSATTDLLLNLNGSNGSTTFTDSSSNSRSITLQTGSPSLNTTTKKYGSAALSINSGSIGNESYIIPDLSNMDWSIEFWIYRPTATAAYEGLVYLANSSGVDNGSGANIHLYTNNDIYFNNNGQAAVVSNTSVTSGVWHHVACVQDGDYKKVFFNGVLMGVSKQATPVGPYKIRIGRSYGYWAGSSSSAYIDDLKITRGKCAYYQDFVPPTVELTTSTATATIGTTVLLLKGNGTNNSTTFTDDGHKTLTPTRNGNTVISTAQYKYGTASIYFDGTGDYLTYSTGKDNFNFFNSNFTIECWIRPSSVTGVRVIFSKRANTSTYGGFIFQLNGNKLNIIATNNGSSWGINIDSTTTLSTNTWYHVAATRLNDTFKIFIDGNLEGSQSIENFIISGNTSNMVIGAGGAAGSQEFFGYIDDLRIVRGASLYNNSFTSPSSELGLYP